MHKFGDVLLVPAAENLHLVCIDYTALWVCKLFGVSRCGQYLPFQIQMYGERGQSQQSMRGPPLGENLDYIMIAE